MSRPPDWQSVFGIDDPTPGDPYVVRSVSTTWGGIADKAQYAEQTLRGLMADDAVATWIGQAGQAFQAKSSDLPDQLHKAWDSYQRASDAMSWWAGRLGDHQYDADAALVKGRAAKLDLDSAQHQLASANSSVGYASGAGPLNYHGAPDSDLAPTTEQVTAARNALTSAQHAQSAASSAVSDAQHRLDVARQMAQEAGQLRESDGRTTAGKIHDASDAGIKERSRWQKIKDGVKAAWDVIVQIAKIVVLVLGVVALIIGGPLAWVVFAAALIVLADTLMKYMKGEATLLDVVLAAVSCIPGTKGLTTLKELTAAFKAGGLLGAAGHILISGKTAIVDLAKGLRAMGAGLKVSIKNFTVSGLLALTLRFGRPADSLGDLAGATSALHYPNMFMPDGLPLGALHLPQDGVVGDLLKGYDRFGGMTPEEFSRAVSDGKGGYDWSKVPYRGFEGDSVVMDMKVGDILDRFGPTDGRFLSPPGTPFPERGLPPSNLDGTQPNFDYHQYRVISPFNADVGYIAPAMAQPGGGLQVFINGDHIPHGTDEWVNVQWLLDHDFLEIVNP